MQGSNNLLLFPENYKQEVLEKILNSNFNLHIIQNKHQLIKNKNEHNRNNWLYSDDFFSRLISSKTNQKNTNYQLNRLYFFRFLWNSFRLEVAAHYFQCIYHTNTNLLLVFFQR